VTTPAPGWYPDPAQPDGTRWWDGQAWTEHVAAAPAPQPQTWGAPQPAVAQQPWAATGQPWSGPGQRWGATGQPWGSPPAQRSWLRRNALSLSTIGVVVLYLLLLAAAHVAVLGILPIVLAVRALRGKEPMAIPATVLAVLAFLLGLYQFSGR
jgi:hypothetical protein